MTYWLLIFLWDIDGSFVDRIAVENPNKSACVAAAGKDAAKRVNTSSRATYFCVTDDHWTGKNVDPDVPLDFLDFAESEAGDI